MSIDISNIKIPQFPDINALQAQLHEKKDDSMYQQECSNCGRKFKYKERQCPDCSNPIKFHYIGECVLFKCPRCGKRIYHLRDKEYLCPHCKDEEDVKLICTESDFDKQNNSNNSTNSNNYNYESFKWHICKNKWSMIIGIIGFILGTIFTLLCTYLFNLL